MTCVFTPSICHINLSAIVRNFSRLGSPQNIMPVVKSDAYGHGLLPIAAALSQNGARHFAVGGVSEGLELRKAGFKQNIMLLMGCLNKSDWQHAINNNLTPFVGNFDDLQIAESLLWDDRQLNIAIKCDTGMGRLGFKLDQLAPLLETLKKSRHIKPVMLASHLASADMPEDFNYTSVQINTFKNFHNAIKIVFPEIMSSLGNSAATLGLAEAYFDILRPGLALYGGNPFANTSKESLGFDLEWAMSLEAPIVQVHNLKAGQSISYGRIFTAAKDMRVAVVAAGYATGIARNLSGQFSVLIHGRRVPQIGRICMGMLIVDASDVPILKKGDSAWILGGEPVENETPVTVQELAEKLNTIPYELLCLIGSLNPRVYH